MIVSRKQRFGILAIFTPTACVLSSGPVISMAFWLREATRIDTFYNVMWAYYPLIAWGTRSLWDPYIGS